MDEENRTSHLHPSVQHDCDSIYLHEKIVQWIQEETFYTVF